LRYKIFIIKAFLWIIKDNEIPKQVWEEKNMKKKANNIGTFIGKKKMSHRLFFSDPRTGEGGAEDA
jgi:hypothetical protein